MESAVYHGAVWHRRRVAPAHAFRFRLAMLYLDLDELPQLFRGRWLWGLDGPGLASFHRSDHLGDPRRPLADCGREQVEAATGRRPEGPIRLLTHPRHLGYVFNPISVFYCFDRSGRLEAAVGEVSNTPWGERHLYVLGGRGAEIRRGTLCQDVPKAFHVSPFLPMDLAHRFRVGTPGRHLGLRIADLDRAGRTVFEAVLALRRRAFGGRALADLLLRHPLLTQRVIAAIYTQAFRLRRRGAAVFPHPGEAPKAAPGATEGGRAA